MLRRALRILARATRLFLLTIALAAALVWAWSYYVPGKLEVHRWTGWWGVGGGKNSRDGSVNQTSIAVGCGYGRLGVERLYRQDSGYTWASAREQAERDGNGWIWETHAGSEAWYAMEGGSALGPFRWGYSDRWDPDNFTIPYLCAVSTRCWVVVAVAGAWPFASLTLLARRHLRARRLARIGRCPACGYHLRATPGRCPECGTIRD